MKKLALLIGLFVFLVFAGTVKADSWADTNYSARVAIQITNTGEFQPEIILNSSVANVSAMQPDGCDLKFYANDNTTRLNHYLEYDTINTSSGNSYVRVDVANQSTIWLYYKNTTAVPCYSNPESISPAGIGDNFSASAVNTSKWTDIPAWGTLWGQEGGFLILNASGGSAAVYSNAQLLSPNVTVKWAFNVTINPSYTSWEMIIRGNDGTYNQAYAIRSDSGIKLQKLQSGWQNLATINATVPTSQDGTAYIKQIGDSLTACVNTTATQACASATDSTYTSGNGVTMYKYINTGGDDILKVDWVYAVNESNTLTYTFGSPEQIPSWKNRRAIILNETINKVNEPVRMNFTGLTFSDIKEITIFDNNGIEVPQVDIVSYQNGSGNAWAVIKFIANYNTSEASHNYWIYYNYSGAPAKTFTTKIFFDNFSYNNSNSWSVFKQADNLTTTLGTYGGINNGYAWVTFYSSNYVNLYLDTGKSEGYATVFSINLSNSPSIIGRGFYNTHYLLQHGSSATAYYLYKLVSGSYTAINNSARSYAAGQLMGWSLYGSSQKAYWNDSLVVTGADTAINASWNNTWWGFQDTTGSGVTEYLDNFCFIYYPSNESFHCTTYDTSIVTTEGVEQSLPVSLSVNLNLPVNNNITNATTTTMNFNCSATSSSNLTNMTLYGNWGGWHANETQIVSGNFSYATFSKSLSQGTYTWNCQACDTSGCAFGTGNYTFTIELYKIPSINITSPVGFYNNWNNTDKTFNNTWSKQLIFTNDTKLYQVYYSIDGTPNINTSNGSILNLDVMKHNITVCGSNIIGEWGCDTDYFEINGGTNQKILFNYTIPLDRGTIYVSTLDSFDWDGDGVKEIAIGTGGNDASVWVLDNCSSPSCTQAYLPPKLVAYTKTSGGAQTDRWVWMIDTGDMGGSSGVLNEFCVGTGGTTPTYIKCYRWNGTWYDENYSLNIGGSVADIEALHFCDVDNDSKAEFIGALYDSSGGGYFLPIHNYTETTPTAIGSCRPHSALSCQDIDGDGVNESIMGCADSGGLQELDWNGTAYKVYNLANSPCSGYNSMIFQKDVWDFCDYNGDGNKELMMFCAGGTPTPFSNYTRFNATSLINTSDTQPFIVDWGGQPADSRYPNECSIATSYGNRSIYRNVTSNEVIFKGRPSEGNKAWFFNLWADVDNDGYSEVGEVQYEYPQVQGNRTIMMLDFSPPVPIMNITWNTPANNSFTLNLSSIVWNATISDTPNTCILNINGTTNYTMLISGYNCYYTTSSLINQTTYCGTIYANNSVSNVSSMRCATINLTEAAPIPPTPIENLGIFGGISLLIIGAGILLFLMELFLGEAAEILRNPKILITGIIGAIIMIAIVTALLI
jgi:uncharacterized membrane protein YeaQ/YmgE (transglycosylase-associated protein family)